MLAEAQKAHGAPDEVGQESVPEPWEIYHQDGEPQYYNNETGEIVCTLAEVMEKIEEDASMQASIRASQEQLTKERDEQQKIEEEDERWYEKWVEFRRSCACESHGCRFHAHTSMKTGNYCCFLCLYTNGVEHGEWCERAEPCKKTLDRPPQPAWELSTRDLQQTAVEDSVGPPLFQAVRRGDLLRLTKLLRNGCNPNSRNETGVPLLFEATARGQSNVVAKLLVSKANPCLLGVDGQTADSQSNDEAIRDLLQLFTDRQCGSNSVDDSRRDAALDGLSAFIRDEVVQRLGEVYEPPMMQDEDVQSLWEVYVPQTTQAALNHEGNVASPLFSCVQNNELNAVLERLRAGDDPNVRDCVGETPLFEAVAGGSLDLVATLLMWRADPSLKSLSGQTADAMTSNAKTKCLLQIFLDKAGDFAQESNASGSGTSALSKDPQRGSKSVADSDMNVALDGLSAFIRDEVVQRLETVYAPPMMQAVQNHEGNVASPLFSCVQNNDVNAVLELLRAGEDPNVRDCVGETPLFEAVAGGSVELVEALLMWRADPSLKSLSGQTAEAMTSSAETKFLLQTFLDEAGDFAQESNASRSETDWTMHQTAFADLSENGASKGSLTPCTEMLLGGNNRRPGYDSNEPVRAPATIPSDPRSLSEVDATGQFRTEASAAEDLASAEADPMYGGSGLDERLIQAVTCGDPLEEILDLLDCSADPNIEDMMGTSVLSEATTNGEIDVVAALLVHRADPNRCSGSGVMPDAETDNSDIISLLQLFGGSKVDSRSRNSALRKLGGDMRRVVVQRLMEQG